MVEGLRVQLYVAKIIDVSPTTKGISLFLCRIPLLWALRGIKGSLTLEKAKIFLLFPR
jgi:hypothetical protein